MSNPLCYSADVRTSQPHPVGPVSALAHRSECNGLHNTPHCPRCDAKMVLRTYRQNGGRFWGCTTFPECKGFRPHERD